MPEESSRPKDTDPELLKSQVVGDEPDNDDDEYEEEHGQNAWHAVFMTMPSWLISTLVHLAVLLILAALYLPMQLEDIRTQLVAAPGENEQIEELEELDDEPFEDIDVETEVQDIIPSDVEASDVDYSAFDEPSALAAIEVSDMGIEAIPMIQSISDTGSLTGSALSGRGSGKGTLIAQGGGSEGSEKAVKMALDWLAEHQMPDGGWSFDLTKHPKCRGQCKNSGTATDARNAATGLALLPFLGAGQTHIKGAYKDVVNRGLYYLMKSIKITPRGGSWHESDGRMYSHGICSIVMCEAYAMTQDRKLYAPAQQSIQYICYAQDPVGGGWRYNAHQAGDTSVVGWQLMALKSANMGYLKIPRETLTRSVKFLDTVQADGGAQYGYDKPATGRAATTSIGLLCRMYMGWKKGTPALERGVNWIGNKGPSQGDAYYNYYATQVMRHWGGVEWDKWNTVMRDQLVNSQVKTGHERGSWYASAGHGDRGGRLYVTSMSTMVLEVYYRHLPIYRKQTTEDSFEID